VERFLWPPVACLRAELGYWCKRLWARFSSIFQDLVK
jgi:hypothetical protein